MQVSVSQGGIPKVAVQSAHVTATGIVGDAWRYPFHGGRNKAILLITGEGIDELVAQGFPLYPGALGENLTTVGVSRRDLRLGQCLRVGDATIQLTQIRTPCGTLDVYGRGIQATMYDAQVQAGNPQSDRWGLSGFYASVIAPGIVQAGDSVSPVD